MTDTLTTASPIDLLPTGHHAHTALIFGASDEVEIIGRSLSAA